MSQRVLVLLVVCTLVATCVGPAAGQEWTVVWNGADRPGPENLPFDRSGICGGVSPFICAGGPRDGQPCLSGDDEECQPGWPYDEEGFELYDSNECYDGPGPYYAEAANVDTAGYLSIQNLYDGTCEGVGVNVVDDPAAPGYQGPCGDNIYQVPGLDLAVDPCGMRYLVGPRTMRDFWGPSSEDLIHYQSSFGFGFPEPAGMTMEVSFYIAEIPTQWTTIMRMVGYFRHGSPASNPRDSAEFKLRLRHFMDGRPDNEWHLVLGGGNGVDLGKAEDLMNRWITIRAGIGVFEGKQQKFGWMDGLWITGPMGWRDINPGGGMGQPHSFAYWGWSSDVIENQSGDVRIGTMAFSHQGSFSPNPCGECQNLFHDYYFPYLPAVLKTPAEPEICDNGTDDDGDGQTDCDDPECYQDAVCGNLLVNGSFEDGCDLVQTTCPIPVNTNLPIGWQLMPGDGGTLLTNGSIWIPSPPRTHGFVRGSVDRGGVGNVRAYQTVELLPGDVTLKGSIAGEGLGYEIFVELLDGDHTSTNVIDRFSMTGVNGAGDPPVQDFRPFEIGGPNTTTMVTVRWGTDSGIFSLPHGAHVDNLYLTGVAIPPCSEPWADADRDGDIDADDFGIFQRCVTGPGNLNSNPLCYCFDVEGPVGGPDGDIDGGDFQEFQNCATGPDVPFEGNEPAGCNW